MSKEEFNPETRVFLSPEIFHNEYDFLYGDKSAVSVSFIYRRMDTGKETVKNGYTYPHALGLARRRRSDARYRNYEFVIRVQQ